MKKLAICFLVLFLAGCHHLPGEREVNETTQNEKLSLANPASVFCVEQGGQVDIRDEEMGQVGYCLLPDGTEREEWEFFRENQAEEVAIEPVVPANCESWFDGCNNCMVEEGVVVACTRMFCPPEMMEEPKCVKFLDEAPIETERPEESVVEMPEEDMRVCTMEWAPVCGVDGVTYGNDCMAGEVEIAHEGECETEDIKKNS